MLKWLLILIFCVPHSWAFDFRSGDVILQPLKCYLCGLIEQHENSSFAHLGIVIEVAPKEVWVAESLGKVKMIRLSEFLAKGDKTRPHKLIRPREQVRFALREALEPLIGADYDHDFRWDNLGRDGREALYCSELVTKLLNPFLQNDIPTKLMDYTQNAEAWSRYFRGNVPQGLPGNSPGDFERSPLFVEVATYQDNRWNWK